MYNLSLNSSKEVRRYDLNNLLEILEGKKLYMLTRREKVGKFGEIDEIDYKIAYIKSLLIPLNTLI